MALLGPAPPDRGGIAHQTALLARSLGDSLAGYFTYSRPYPKLFNPRRFDRVPSVPADDPHAVAALDWRSPRSWRAAARTIVATEASAVVAPWWTAFWALPLSGVFREARRREARFRSVLLCHHVFDHESAAWKRALAWRAFSAADGVIAQTQADRETIGERFPAKPVSVLPHPVERRPRADRQAARRKLGVEGPLVLMLGLVRPYKGLDVLVDAAPKIAEATGAKIAVVGEVFPESRKSMESLKTRAVFRSIELVDRYVEESEMDEWLAACDVVVCPYRKNSGSGIAARALAARRPIVASDLPGFRPFVTPSTGELVPEGSSELLARAVIRVLRSGVAAYERALAEVSLAHGWEPYAREVADFCRSLG